MVGDLYIARFVLGQPNVAHAQGFCKLRRIMRGVELSVVKKILASTAFSDVCIGYKMSRTILSYSFSHVKGVGQDVRPLQVLDKAGAFGRINHGQKESKIPSR